MQRILSRKSLLKTAVLASGIFASMAAHAAIDVSTALTTTQTDNTITFSGAGSVTTSGSAALSQTGAAAGSITISNTSAATEVATTGANAISIAAAVTGSTVSVAAGAVAQASGGHALAMVNTGGAFSLTNNGTMSASGTGAFDVVNLTGAGAFGATIVNTGTIQTSSTTGNAINSALSNAAGIMTLTNSGTILGNVIMSGGAGTNVLKINGGSVLTGNVSSSGNITTTIGDTVAGSFSTGGTMALGTGTLGVVTAGTTFNVGHAVTSSGTATYGLNTTTNFNATTALTGAQVVTGTVRIAPGVSTAAAAGGSTITGTATTGKLIPQIRGANASLAAATGQMMGTAATLNAGFTVAPELAGSGYLLNGTTFDYVKGTLAATDNSTLVQPSSAVISFTKSIAPNTTDLRLTAVRTPYQTVASAQNSKNVGQVLENLNTTVNSDLGAIVGNLDRQATAADLNNGLGRLTPEVNGSVTAASFGLQNQGLGTVSNRLDNLRASIETPNYAAGESDCERGAWVQVFGNFADQKDRYAVVGYKADTFGVGLGTDWMAMDSMRVGIGASMGSSRVDSRHITKNKLDIDSWQGNLYGTYSMGDSIYVDGMVGFAHNKYEGKRRVVVGTEDRTAASDYHGSLFTAKLGAGYSICNGDFETIPMVGYQFSHLRLNDYTETGAGSANLFVNNSNLNANVASLGAKFRFTHASNRGKLVPEVRVALFHDFSGEEASTVSRFVNSGVAFGDSFISKGAKVARTSYSAGLGLGIYTMEEMKITAAYDYEAKADYSAHSGSVNFRYEW